MENHDTAKHVRAALAGDREAFRRLVEDHYRQVFGICFRLANSVHDAEDLAHEAFVEAYVKLRTLREPAKFTAWLKTLTLNVCRMWYRRNARDPVELRADLSAAEDDAPPEEDLDRARMWYGLSLLPTEHRFALVLRHVEGLSYEEIAVFLEIPIGTVMSRLHRARSSLKKQIEALQEVEAIPMITEEQFQEEVDAEISVLLEMFHEEPSAMERLSVVLSRAPERLRQLVRETEETHTLDNLARLLPRLGAEAMGTVLGAALAEDLALQEKALVVLRGLITRCRSTCGGIGTARGALTRSVPSFDAYLLVDRLLTIGAERTAKAKLLVGLLEACEDFGTGQLLCEAAMCFPEESYPLLLQRFWEIRDPAEVYRKTAFIVRALKLAGRRFCRDLTAAMGSGPPAKTRLALAGLDELVKGAFGYLQSGGEPSVAGPRWITETEEPEDFSLVQLDRKELAAAADTVAAYLRQDDADLRDTAIRTLGRLESHRHAGSIRDLLSHDHAGTRISAAQALAFLSDAQSAEPLRTLARDRDATCRRAAIEALGHLGIAEAEGTLRCALEDAKPPVRKAAVIALGELKTPTAAADLERLLKSRDKVVRRAAASAVFGGTFRRPAGGQPVQPVEESPRAKRLRKTFGRMRYIHHVSVDGPLRVLPEIRAYDVVELTRHVARICGDRSASRRLMVEHGLLRRTGRKYEFTPLGEAAWRVEHSILEHFMRCTDGDSVF